MTEAADIARKINQRKAHRGIVTKTIAKVDEAIKGEKAETRETRELLYTYKISLVEKLDVLQRLDDEIGATIDAEAEIVTELEKCDEVRQKIHLCCTTLQNFLDSTGQIEVQEMPMQRHKSTMLPKLKIPELLGNPMEF